MNEIVVLEYSRKMPLKKGQRFCVSIKGFGVNDGQIIDGVGEKGLFLEQIFEIKDGVLVISQKLVDLGSIIGEDIKFLRSFSINMVLYNFENLSISPPLEMLFHEGASDRHGQFVALLQRLLTDVGQALVSVCDCELRDVYFD